MDDLCPKVFSVRNGQVVPGGKDKHDDTGTRVPLIANWPGHLKPGTQVNEMVDLTDFLPTLAELVGSTDEDVPCDGISFAPLLRGTPRSRTRPWIYSEHRGERSIRSKRWRLHENGRLFDVQQDPHERNVIAVEALEETAAADVQALRQAMAEIQTPLNWPSHRPDEASTIIPTRRQSAE